MTETRDEVARASALSRRRVIHGIAWSAPAVLVATASPAAAASGGASGGATPGAITLASTTAAHNTHEFSLGAMVAYAASAASPVTGVTLEFALPAARVTGADPTIVSGAGWSYDGRATDGSNATFTFSWTGTQLSMTSGQTVPLAITVPKSSDESAISVTMTARGVSEGGAVLPSVVTAGASALVGNAPTFAHGGAVRFQEWVQSNPKVDAWVINAALAWTGPWWPVAPDLTDLAVEIRVPAGQSDGTLLPSQSGIGAGWTADGAPRVVDGSWLFRYVYAGAIGDSTKTTKDLQFAIKAPAATAPKASYRITGRSGGTALVTSGSVSR